MEPRTFYRLRRPDFPWGDYSDILVHGMGERGDAGLLELERVGPFMPPISQPSGFVVVTVDFLRELESSGLTGFSEAPVIKKRVTKIEWRDWEPYGPKEMKYPAGNEPENYVLRRKHSAEAAEALGELREIRFNPGIDFSREGCFHLVASSWNGADCFTLRQDDWTRANYVSERARDWLMDHAAEWVVFEKARAQ